MRFLEKSDGIDSNAFIKLGDKGQIVGVFRGEFETFRRHWDRSQGPKGRGVNCPGKENGCAICARNPDEKPSWRFRVNFLTEENGQWVAKVFEGGWKLYSQLRTLHEDYDLEKQKVKITRQGSEMNNTVYNVNPVPKGEVDAQLEAKLQSVPLVELAPKTPGNEAEEPAEAESDIRV